MSIDNPCTVQQIAIKWGISIRRVSKLCEDGRIQGAEKFSDVWMIPENAEKPDDERTRSDFSSDETAKPFIKWAGGKGQLIDTIREYYPIELGKSIRKYAEPFIGGGAVLFDILNRFGDELDEVYISDINSELIDTYRTIKEQPDELIDALRELQTEHMGLDMDRRREFFKENRDLYNDEMVKSDRDRVTIASEFIYLNKTCFNGLYRVNSKGLFNVPSGVYKNPMICDETNIRNVSERLQNVTIRNASYRESKYFIDSETFVYFDPPYRPLTESSSFTSYTKLSFDDDDQRDLAQYVHELTDMGAKVAVSNSDPKNVNPEDDFFDDIYSFATVNRVQANRMINSKGDGRGKINEILVTNYPKPDRGSKDRSVTLEEFY